MAAQTQNFVFASFSMHPLRDDTSQQTNSKLSLTKYFDKNALLISTTVEATYMKCGHFEAEMNR
jgi:hypothetical protein